MAALPQYIHDRLTRNPPAKSSIVKRSTPVLAFGDLFSSHAATLGLNPSSLEFLDSRGRLLDGDARRLATLKSLNLDELADATSNHAEQIAEECARYFERNPFRKWFNQLEPMLNKVGASYYNRTACHVDLVQWATKPKWRGLSSAVRRRLLDADASFLAEQLECQGIRYLLLNGRGVIKNFTKAFGTRLSEEDPLVENGRQPTRVFSGQAFGHVRVIGWSTNLQSSHGVTTARREALADRIAVIAAA